MIQRIQSVFLLIVFVCMLCVAFLPLWQKNHSESAQEVQLSALVMKHRKAEQVITEKKLIYLAVLALAAAAVAFISLLSYSNRMRQMQYGMLNALTMTALMTLTIFQILQAAKLFEEQDRGEFQPAFWLIVVALVANVLANRFIRKDEMLVRSADRIR